jgi:gamma-glutamyl-gamma-aminobutyraldehyde dehydrogenase
MRRRTLHGAPQSLLVITHCTSRIDHSHDLCAPTLPARLPAHHVIGGAQVPAATGATLDTVNPGTGQVIGTLPAGDAQDVDRAVASARQRFESGQWRDMKPAERKKRLLALADRLEAAAEEFAVLETIDPGKPISDTRNVDVPLALGTLRFYAEAVDKIHGEVGPTGPDKFSYAVHDPLGVIGAIVPWNFPLLMAMWKIAPALAMGNSMVVKPSELSSLTALRFAELALEAGLPDGVLNVVTGTGQDAGAALALHGDVDMITFTGSGPVGRQLMRYSADSNLKRVSLELGGKSPHIVFADYPDLDRAAAAAAWGSSTTRARSAPPDPACWCSVRSMPSSWRKSWPWRGPSAPAIRSIRPRNWVR